MEFNEYQEAIHEYKPFENEIGIFYNLIEVSSSIGDLNKKFNNMIANNIDLTRENAMKLGISLGDILNAISNFAYEIGIKLEDVALLNLKKIDIQKRKQLKEKNNNPTKFQNQ